MALSSSRWGISVCNRVGEDLTCAVFEEESVKKAGLLLFSLNCQHSSWLLSSKLCHSRVRISCLWFLFRPFFKPSTLYFIHTSASRTPSFQHCMPLLITPPVCFLVSPPPCPSSPASSVTSDSVSGALIGRPSSGATTTSILNVSLLQWVRCDLRDKEEKMHACVCVCLCPESQWLLFMLPSVKRGQTNHSWMNDKPKSCKGTRGSEAISQTLVSVSFSDTQSLCSLLPSCTILSALYSLHLCLFCEMPEVRN